LYVLQKENLCDCGKWVNGVWEWKLNWRRGHFAWEEDQVSQLLETISNKRPKLETVGRWVWKDRESASFSVKFAYGLLRGEGVEENSRMYNFLWKALPLAHVTTWRVIENKVATKVNLERRGIGVESNFCCLCKVSEESTNNLFFECKVVWLIWNLCYDWLKVSLVDLLIFGSHFEHFKILDASTSVNLLMSNVWIVLVS